MHDATIILVLLAVLIKCIAAFREHSIFSNFSSLSNRTAEFTGKHSGARNPSMFKDFANQTKVYALYFPQFHEDPVNNQLWGKGYTDWDNVKRTPEYNRYNAMILRPTPPLGYYDLTDVKIRKLQAEFARNYSIDGFIYHHYWFHNENETAVLSKPLELMLVDGEPNISFAFNWAMETWVGTWHGRGNEGEVLYEQHCPNSGDPRYERHYAFLRRFFHHPNYIKINGVPLFTALRNQPGICLRALQALRELAMKDGFPPPGLYLMGGSKSMTEHELYTGDPPVYHEESDIFFSADYYYPFSHFRNQSATIPHRCYSVKAVQEFSESMNHRAQYVSLMTMFDNTPRRDWENSVVWNRTFSGTSAVKSFYFDLLTTLMYERCCQTPAVRDRGGKFVVVNAWNEWGEGMVLEPSNVYDKKFLEAVKAAKLTARAMGCNWHLYRTFVHRHGSTLFSHTKPHLKQNDQE